MVQELAEDGRCIVVLAAIAVAALAAGDRCTADGRYTVALAAIEVAALAAGDRYIVVGRCTAVLAATVVAALAEACHLPEVLVEIEGLVSDHRNDLLEAYCCYKSACRPGF